MITVNSRFDGRFFRPVVFAGSAAIVAAVGILAHHPSLSGFGGRTWDRASLSARREDAGIAGGDISVATLQRNLPGDTAIRVRAGREWPRHQPSEQS
jgi:hypothetical protein